MEKAPQKELEIQFEGKVLKMVFDTSKKSALDSSHFPLTNCDVC